MMQLRERGKKNGQSPRADVQVWLTSIDFTALSPAIMIGGVVAMAGVPAMEQHQPAAPETESRAKYRG